MKYKAGDFVTLPETIPKDRNDKGNPGWNSNMDSLLGQTLPIAKTNAHTSPPSYYIGGWWWSEHWLNNNTPLATLEERICNKIKEIDNKWKERQLKCA